MIYKKRKVGAIMNIVLIFDQVQAGLGGKENPMLPLGGKKMGIGAANMLQPFLDKYDGHIVATLYCGDGFFTQNEKEVTEKIAAMAKKINPDVVIAGPSYDYKGYANMCAQLGVFIEENINIPVVTAMSQECASVIDEYKDTIDIVQMPKKGGTGLTDSLNHICQLAYLKVNNDSTLTDFTNKYCY